MNTAAESHPAAVDAGTIADTAARLVGDDVIILPVRHHSPACAHQVRRAIESYAPAAVLVEGPHGFTPLITALTDPGAAAPLAVYTYLDPVGRGSGAPRVGAYYPFCDFSPELVALRSARRRGIPARFIDLDLGAQHAAGRHAAEDPVTLLDEHHFRLSDRLARLTEQLGCRDEEDLWEHLFEAEAHTVGTGEYLRQLSAYCLLARADTTAAQLRADGTAAREAEMTWHVRQAISEFGAHGPILVVVGGFHAVVLPDLLADPPPRPAIRAPEGHAALVRFSFDRVDRVSGYAAGITAPAWQQRVWEQLSAPTPHTARDHPRTHAAREALLDVADELDRIGRRPSQPSLSDAHAHAVGLAALRDRGGPLRSDLLDAVRATLVKGDVDTDGAAILAGAARALSGDRLGALPSGVAAPPLVADTVERLRRARLDVDRPVPGSVSLAVYRSPTHRMTSRLLHGLGELEIPFAECTGGPDFVAGTDLHLINEHWDYRWSPNTEAALVEASRYGNTLPAAVAARFDDHIDSLTRGGRHHDSATSAATLMRACRLGLTEGAEAVLAMVGADLAADPSFCGVSTAASTLTLIRAAREPLGAEHLDGLPELVRTALHHALYLGRLGPTEPAAEVVGALITLRELTAHSDTETLFAELIGDLAHHHADTRVRGGAVGLCYGAGLLDGPAVAANLAQSINGTLPPAVAVGFLHGLMQTAREALWQEAQLVDVLGQTLGSWSDDEFVHRLPELRLAMAELTPRETDRVARVVAHRLGIADLGPLDRPEIGADDLIANLSASRVAAELFTADGLGDWIGGPVP